MPCRTLFNTHLSKYQWEKGSVVLETAVIMDLAVPLQRFSYQWGPDYEKIIESILAANEDNYQPRFDQKKNRLIISTCKSYQLLVGCRYPSCPCK